MLTLRVASVAWVSHVLALGVYPCQGWTQAEVELVLSNRFEVLGLICDTIITVWCHIAGFSIHHRQIDAIGIVFGTDGPRFSSFTASITRAVLACRFLFVSTIRRRVRRTQAQAGQVAREVVGGRHTEAVAILETHIFMTIFRAFLVFLSILTFIRALILQRKIQTINQTKEIIITISRQTVSTAIHKVIGPGVRITAKYRQHIGPGFNVIHDAVITAVIK